MDILFINVQIKVSIMADLIAELEKDFYTRLMAEPILINCKKEKKKPI